MKISFDEAKRQLTLRERGLDFADAAKVFAGKFLEFVDDRFDYGEARFVAYGEVDGRMVAVVWTPREEGRRIISMRHVHDEEIRAREGSMD